MAVKSPSSLRHRYHHSRGAPLYLMLVVLLFVVSLYFHLQKLKNTLPNLFSTDPSSRLTSKPSKASTTDVVNAQGTERVDEVVSNLTSVKITNCSGRGLDERSNKKCYVFWSGPPMDGARKGAFEKMKALIEYDCDVFVQLVTRDNLLSFENPERPLHPAVLLQPGLSGVHFSDYLRSYFMHNHGGCYHDIKVLTGPPKLGELFERMAKNESIYMIGAPEGGPEDIGCDHDYARLLNVTCEYVVGKWKSLLSNGMYMVRKQTDFTDRWLSLVEHRLTEKYEMLKEHPSPLAGRCCQGQDTKGYPISWTELGGSALHPVQAVYSNHIQIGFPWFDRGMNYRSITEDG